MAKNSELLQSAANLVQQFFLEELPPGQLYHNYDYVNEVVDVVKGLTRPAGYSKEKRVRLQLVAYFQSCGNFRQPEEVAIRSKILARQFLEEHQYPQEGIDEVTSLIEFFHSGKTPASEEEKILHDARWSFIGRKRFFRRVSLLRMELEALRGENYNLKEWNSRLLKMLTENNFHSQEARKNYSGTRQRNIIRLRNKMQKDAGKMIRRKTGKNFGRGVDTLYRITLRNHIALSSIADGKANMMISINTLVLSILITASAAGFSIDNPVFNYNLYYAIPVLVLMLSSLLAIIFAVLSAIPKVSGVEFGEEDIKQHKVSLLFFGNFLQLSKTKFVSHLRELKKDQELLYDDLSRDLYNLGEVLRKKYRLLTISYRVFVGGLVLSFLVFLFLMALK